MQSSKLLLLRDPGLCGKHFAGDFRDDSRFPFEDSERKLIAVHYIATMPALAPERIIDKNSRGTTFDLPCPGGI